VAILLSVGTGALLHVGFYKRAQISDVPIYERYGDAVARGNVPYRDYGLEYPPGALPVFVLPALGNEGDRGAYRATFELEMWFCGALVLVLMALALRAIGAGRARLWAALAFAVVAPLLLGSVVRSRFDLWPAAVATGALAALVAGRRLVGLGALGAAFAVKLWPAALLPLALVYLWRREGRRAAAAGAAAFAAVAGAIFLPFVALSADGVHHALTRQTGRPLQVESLASGVLLALHQLGLLSIRMKSSFGSQNLAGSLPDALATAQTVVELGLVAALCVAFTRGPATPERLLRYAAATVCAFVAFGKVLSPQFLIWLIPLVPLVRGRRGVAASALLGAILVLTQLWFPHRYWSLALHFAALPSWLVLVRDVLLVALMALLAWPTPRLSGSLSLTSSEG
jgi:hypothetical protein